MFTWTAWPRWRATLWCFGAVGNLPFFDGTVAFGGFSETLDFLDFSRDDVDELEEYELSDPESLESDEPEPEELDRRLRLSVDSLRTGEA